MFRRLTSHLIISLAVFTLIASFYVWFLDSVLLNPSRLVPTLNDAGVMREVATLLPEKVAENADSNERDEIKAKITQIVTPQYAQTKVDAIAQSMTTFIREGSPQPTLDISDFPAKLRQSGVDVGQDIDKNFAKPIELNKSGNLDKLPQVYKFFKYAKIIGIVIFVLLLVLEWYIAVRGEKMKRIGRVFLHAGLWFFTFWAVVAFLPSRFLPKLKQQINDVSVYDLLDSVARAIKHLFGGYFLSAAVVCAVLAISLYLLRHAKKHIKTIEEQTVQVRKKTQNTTAQRK